MALLFLLLMLTTLFVLATGPCDHSRNLSCKLASTVTRQGTVVGNVASLFKMLPEMADLVRLISPLPAPAYTRAPDPLQGHAQTQQHVAERIRLNSEMLQQIQQIRQLQEIQQRQDLEERMRRARQQRDQLYQQHRDVLLQQHQRQQDELRRQNELRFIQHMTQQPPGQPLQLGQNTINVQTALPRVAAPHHPPPPFLRFQIPSSVRIGAPSAGATPSPGTPPIVNLTLGPRPIGALSSSNPQLSRPPQNTAPK